MYSGLPPRNRVAVKISLGLAWAFSTGAGLSAIILSPTTIISEIGAVFTILSGVLLAAATLVAMIGVFANRYWLEWISSWAASLALVPYLVTVWALTLTGEPTRSTQAFLITSLLTFFITRAELCAAHAAKLRLAHEGSSLITDALISSAPSSEGGTADVDDAGSRD